MGYQHSAGVGLSKPGHIHDFFVSNPHCKLSVASVAWPDLMQPSRRQVEGTAPRSHGPTEVVHAATCSKHFCFIGSFLGCRQ